MTDTDGMTLEELKDFLADIDSVEQLDALEAMEKDGQDRKGAHELIEARRAFLEEGPATFPVYSGKSLVEGDHLVATPTGEVSFTVTVAGEYQPQDEGERQAVELVGAKPRKGN